MPAQEENLAGILSPAFGKAAFRVDRSRPLTFICGGNNDDALRHQFLERVTGPPRRILPVLAERAYPHQLIERNLQSFEEFLANTADCVLIFVESPGSFAETGLFAGTDEVIKKTFVINTREESGKKSFLNLGPIKLIRKASQYDAVVDIANNVVTAVDANLIVEGILSTYPQYQTARVFHPLIKFTDHELRLRLACVHMAVTLMWAGSASLVTSVLRKHFRAVNEEEVERFLALLTSIGLLQRMDEIYFNPSRRGFTEDALIYSADFSVDNVRAQALEWQTENNSHVATFLREKRGVDI